jgi:histidine triad (HIT) family protein
VTEDCIFCSIVSGEAPAHVIDQDDNTMAFLDINPWTRGHSLVIPRRHSKNLYEIDPADLEHSMRAAKRVAAQLRERLGCDDIVLLNSCEPAAWQVVPHFHIHVIPRYADDGLEFPRSAQADPDDVGKLAEQLRL